MLVAILERAIGQLPDLIAKLPHRGCGHEYQRAVRVCAGITKQPPGHLAGHYQAAGSALLECSCEFGCIAVSPTPAKRTRVAVLGEVGGIDAGQPDAAASSAKRYIGLPFDFETSREINWLPGIR